MEFTVREIVEADWRQVRDLRLQALADTPHAFMETLLHAAEQTDEHWQERSRWPQEPDHCGFAAIDGGRWIGTMRGLTEADGWVTLVGVFVAPSHRGRDGGVADALLDSVESWAASTGAPGVRLEVHENNERAQRLYLRRGYEFTGESQPYPLNESERELEMIRPLSPTPGPTTPHVIADDTVGFVCAGRSETRRTPGTANVTQVSPAESPAETPAEDRRCCISRFDAPYSPGQRHTCCARRRDRC